MNNKNNPMTAAAAQEAVAWQVGDDFYTSESLAIEGIQQWGPSGSIAIPLYAAPVTAVPARVTLRVEGIGAVTIHVVDGGIDLPVDTIKGIAANLSTPAAPEAVAYLDIGAGGYLDIGSDLPEEQLLALPNGRHALGIIGTYGIDGYVSAPVTAAPADLISGVLSDLAAVAGSWIVEAAGPSADALNDCAAKMLEAIEQKSIKYGLFDASTPGAPGIDLQWLIDGLDEIGAQSRNLRQGGCDAGDLDGLENGLSYAVDTAHELRDRLLALIDASPKGDDVPHRDLVPGVMRCAKCAFQLHRTNLYLGSGTTGPGDSKTEPCPNGCGPLWPVTWQTWATEGWQQAERYFEELRQLQDSPKGGSDPWRGLYAPERAPNRDEYGCFYHPDIPSWDDEREESIAPLLKDQGFDLQCVPGDFSDEAMEEGGERYWQEMREWNPEPEGDGWRLVAIYDTEDGPYSMFVKPLAQAGDAEVQP